MVGVMKPEPKCCPACGQTLPVVRPYGLQIGTRKQRILEIVQKAGPHGIKTTALFERVYGQDQEGGPLGGNKTLHVHVNQLNKLLRRHHKVIRGERCGGTGQYRDCGSYTLRDL